MKALSGMSYTAEEMNTIYKALHCLEDTMKAQETWLRNEEYIPLPGAEIAVEELRKEIDLIRKLTLKTYKNSYTREQQ